MPESFDYKEAPDLQMLGPDDGPEPSRRGVLFWLGLCLNGLVGLSLTAACNLRPGFRSKWIDGIEVVAVARRYGLSVNIGVESG